MSVQTFSFVTYCACAALLLVLTWLAEVTSSCAVVSYAMDLRSCFKINVVGMDQEVRIEQRETIVETSLGMEMEGLLNNPHRVCR
jgi:hypothetical protein